MFRWDDDKTSIVLVNPASKVSQEFIRNLENAKEYPGHVWISTSGYTGGPKWAGLSKSAILSSAASVNKHLSSNSDDCWIHPLPDFHVGGLGIWARAFLSKARVIPLYQAKWDPKHYFETLCFYKGTLSSLVPTQLHDLIKLGLTPPKSLRGVIIGGAALSPLLFHKARELQWPVLPSYGMTELCSQIATAKISSGSAELHLLDHIQCKTTMEGRLAFRSPALLSCYAFESSEGLLYKNPKDNGWFMTEDLGTVFDSVLLIKGRCSDSVKIAGEWVNMTFLSAFVDDLSKKLKIDAAIAAISDERLGHSIQLFVTKTIDIQSLEVFLIQYQCHTMPYEKIRKIHYVDSIPRSPLGKTQIISLIEKLKKM